MQFLVDIETKKKNLLDKLGHKDFALTEEEKFLLGQDIEIKKFFYSLLARSREIWNEDSKNLFFNLVDDSDLEYIEEAVYYYCLLEEIDSGDLGLFEDTLSYISHSENVFSYFLKKLEDLDYQPEGDLSQFFIDAFIQKNRYDLFGNFRALSDLEVSQEQIEQIVEHYPYDIDRLPFDTSFIERDSLEKLNVYDLLFEWSSNKKSTAIFPILKKKLFSPSTDFREDVIQSEMIEYFYELLDSKEKKQFKDILLKNYQVEFYVEFSSPEEILYNLSTIIEIVKKRGFSSENLINTPFLLKNRDFLDALLERANITGLSKSPLLEEYIPKLIDKINKKAPGYEEFIYFDEELINIWIAYPEVFRAMLRNCIQDASPFYNKIKDTHLYSILWEEIFQNKVAVRVPEVDEQEGVLRKYILSGNIPGLLKNNHHFLNFVSDGCFFHLESDECNQLIESIKDDVNLQNQVFSFFPSLIFSNQQVLEFYLHSYPALLEETLEYINHHENLNHLYTDYLYDMVKEYFISKYHLKSDHLDIIEKNFGPTIVRYITNDNIQKIVNLKDSAFQKLIALFPNTSFTMSLVESIYDSIKQYSFVREYPNVIEIFSHIRHSIEDNDGNYMKDLEELTSVMDEKFYKAFHKKYPMFSEYCKYDPIAFLKELISKMKSNHLEEEELAREILHTITTYYISVKREEYRTGYNMLEELNMPYQLDSKDLDRKLIPYVLKQNETIQVVNESDILEEYSILSFVIQALVENGMEISLACDVIQYYLKEEIDFINDEKIIKANIRTAISVMKSVIDTYLPEARRKEYIEILDNKGVIKRKYYIPKPELDRYQILTTLRLESLEKHILSDNLKSQDIYQSLLATMEKYKLHVMPPCFKTLLDSKTVQIPSDLENIGGFISYYHQVYEDEIQKLKSPGLESNQPILSIANILIDAGVLSSVSNVYKQFLGETDARFIKMNSGHNRAIHKTIGDQRLKEAVYWTLQNFKRTEVTIPCFSEVVEIGKEDRRLMRVVVGNFTHPSNISHGERTDSCMRIGGVGESLFHFCLEDKNGFHIRFEDENTGEYISRVSGFRNGNTVFLNELRYSCNPELYTDDDVIYACKKVSQSMITRSEYSDCPIENVIVHRAYATQDLPAIDLGIYNNKQGLKKFYSDIQNSGIVLASTSTPFAPIHFDKTNVPTYAPAREKAYVGSDSTKLMDRMNRVHAVKLALSGISYEYIEPISPNCEIIYGIASQDWYICLDNLGNIYEEIISIDKRAEKELAIACKKMRELLIRRTTHETIRYNTK